MNGTLFLPTDAPAARSSQAELDGLRRAVETLRREVAGLRCEAGYWKSRHADALRRIEGLKRELEEVQAENRKLKDRLFGKKSEKKQSKDRSNHLDDPHDSAEKEKRKRGGRKGGKGHGRRDYSHLPEVEESVEVPPEERVCPRCGKPYAEMSDTEDSEQIEIEVRIYRRKTRRKRYRSTCDCYGCTRTVTASCPGKLIRKSRLGSSLWAHILLDKFASHRPTARLLEELKQHGLDLAAGTVADGLRRLEPIFTPIYEALIERNRASSLCQADETRWQVFVDSEGKISHRWWLWVFLGEDTVVYRLDPTRSHDVPEGHFADAACVLMVDRYSAYKAMGQVKSGTIKLAFCWSHVRRDFIEVGKGWPELKDWALGWLRRIRRLYRLNRQRLKHPAGSTEFRRSDDALRETLRSMQSQAVEELADKNLRAPCRKVLESLQVHWTGLTLFVDDRRIPLDNNASERKIRGPALGRKNDYGSGALWSGRLSAMMFSIFATLSDWRINPRRWLLWYLNTCAASGGKAPPDAGRFLPWNLRPDQLASLRTADPHADLPAA